MTVSEAREALNANSDDIGGILWRVWHLLDGGDTHGMTPLKLERATNLRWCDPIASFDIERHGRSGRQAQAWRADLLRATAECVGEDRLPSDIPRVQSIVPAHPGEVPLSVELSCLIRAGADDRRLRWTGDRRDEVKVLTSSALGGATDAEARRLREAIESELGDEWVREHGLFIRRPLAQPGRDLA